MEKAVSQWRASTKSWILKYKLSQNAGTIVKKAINRLNIGQSIQNLANLASHASHHVRSLQLSNKSDSGAVGKQGKGLNTISVHELSCFYLVFGL